MLEDYRAVLEALTEEVGQLEAAYAYTDTFLALLEKGPAGDLDQHIADLQLQFVTPFSDAPLPVPFPQDVMRLAEFLRASQETILQQLSGLLFEISTANEAAVSVVVAKQPMSFPAELQQPSSAVVEEPAGATIPIEST